MAIELSAKARVLIGKRVLQPNIILEIEGVNDAIYGAIDVFKLAQFDDPGIYFDMPGLVFDGSVVDPKSKPYISLGSSGATLSQQLLQDKGGTQSITTFDVELIDKDQEITRLITPGVVLEDLLSVRAKCYINYQGGIHPRDSVLFHKGNISNIEAGAATIKLTIDSPERLKTQDIYLKQSNALNGAINNSVTTITVDSTTGFLLPADAGTLKTYIKIDDEIIEYTGTTSTTFTGCVRGSLGTTAAAHDDDQDVNSFYELNGTALDLALKLMLSGATSPFVSDLSVKHYGAISPVDLLSGAIFFAEENIQDRLGLVIGDTITTTGSINVGNNLTDALIVGFGKNDYGSWIVVGNTLTLEYDSTAEASFKSKYNVLPEGLGMIPDEVDVAQHEELRVRFASTNAVYKFYLEDTIKGQDFLNSQVYFPSGFYSLPRKTRASVGITVPPIADQAIVILDENTVSKASDIKSKRSTNKNFYNAIVFAYDKDPITGKYKSGKIEFSATSQNRIQGRGNKPLNIKSDGMRASSDNDTLLRVLNRRLLERYQFGAELYSGIKVLGKAGIALEVGDVTVFGSEALGLVDTTYGSRNYVPKMFEVVNKSLNVKTQEVTVDLLATNFANDGRYGIVSPASIIDAGSTTTKVKIKDSFSTTAPNKEKDKWQNYVGQLITIRSLDYAFEETVTFTGIDPTDDYAMLVNPALSVAPSAGYVVDSPAYDTGTNPRVQALWKLMHCYFTPQIPVTSGTSQTVFDIGAGDVAKVFVGSILRVHNFDYSVDSPETVVTDITGTTITVETALGFVPTSSELIDLVGFPDEGLAYRLI